jgi:alginate O-acetyltransferase complex protein AlgI
MLFTSWPVLLFFTGFFFLYWLVAGRDLRLQNLLILPGSYLFYCWWEWRFLFLLIGASALNYYLGIAIDKTDNIKYRRLLVGVGVAQGLWMLFFYKYMNLHHGLIPLGISFYTFRTLSYLLDIDKGKIRPTRDWVIFFSYVAFFPCIISGPIDRPGMMIPQLEKKRVFDYGQVSDGMRQLLWGLFKKIVVADSCAMFTTDIFNHYQVLNASDLLLGAFLYTIQIYADFSGYSDMAIGASGLLGLKVTRNFNFPFFAQNIADFWRRWHISLTSWMTDYVFTPLTIYFRNFGKMGLIAAIIINFAAIGIWHGPNWTYVLFGILHGCYFIPLILRGTMNKRTKKGTFIKIAGTFLLVMFTFIIFRADTLSQAFGYYRKLFSITIFSGITITEKISAGVVLGAALLMIVPEWLQRDKQHALQIDRIRWFPVRAFIYFCLIVLILGFGTLKHSDFIYIKF